MKIVGYADRLSAAAGDTVGFCVSSEHDQVRAELVRIERAGSPRHSSPLQERVVDAGIPPIFEGRRQSTQSGSFISARAEGEFVELGMSVWFQPTLLEDDARPVLTLGDVVIAVAAHGVYALVSDRPVAALEVPLADRAWAYVSLTVDVDGACELRLWSRDRDLSVTRSSVSPVRLSAPRILVGSSGSVRDGVGETFNGRVARPVVSRSAWTPEEDDRLRAGADAVELFGAARVSALQLGFEPSGSAIPDSGLLTSGGEAVQLPVRATPGPFWSGDEVDYRLSPDLFDGVHLHEDDLVDAGWQTDVTWTVPEGLGSGVYALRVSAGDDVDRIPIVITPAPSEQADVLVVLPTWTYLAYSNWRTYAQFEEDRKVRWGESRGVDERDVWLDEHPEFGLSMYDDHRDGSGVVYSSSRRPIVNIRPDYWTPATRGYRHFAQDLQLIEWLENHGLRVAVATDDELDRRGSAALDGFPVVITGSHPEYVSGAILDALSSYTHTGGRLLYLGGNGFYWVTAAHPAHPGTVEIRRGHAGECRWYSAPGEERLASTGEPGGLWRNRGRAPQRIVGVGFSAHGHDQGYGYRRSERSGRPDADWVFDGVDVGVDDVFGLEGEGLGGAGGDEFDRADVGLGTPVDAAVLATTTGFTHFIMQPPEEKYLGYRASNGQLDPKVRGDVVIFDVPGGGAVFSVGSISWSTAMMAHGQTARITKNVIDRFLTDPGPVLRAMESTPMPDSDV